MSIEMIKIGNLSVSKLIIGGNPFSGFSHQGIERDIEMKRYYTTERIKKTLKKAEKLGINTHIGRADHHIMRVLLEYWDQGGSIQWIAQTCPEIGSMDQGIKNAIAGGAKACYIHGGEMDFRFANKKLSEVGSAIKKIKDAGMPAGIAGHNPEVFTWAENNLNVDFYMCSYYNPIVRKDQPNYTIKKTEYYNSKNRDIMCKLIEKLSKPVIHYKIMAAGRNDPEKALAFVAQHLRPQDAVCIGVYTKDKPGMLEENLKLLKIHLKES